MTTDKKNIIVGIIILATIITANTIQWTETQPQASAITQNWEEREMRNEAVSMNLVEVDNRTKLYYAIDRSQVCKGKSLDRMQRWTNIQGMSMLPTIDTYTTVYWVEYDHNANRRQDIKIGDIVFTSQIMHRVVGTYQDYVLTMGDNNNFYETISYEEIKGVVCATART